MAFNHENLKVYQRTLLFNVKVGNWSSQWEGRHAICDQLPRAAGSVLENIALASAAYSSMKVRGVEYAVGSCLECAACLDLARIKQLLTEEAIYAEKEELSQILRMLIGLRKSWASAVHVVREGTVEYSTQSEGGDRARAKGSGEIVLFHHETLDVYKVGIEVAKAFCSSKTVSRLSNSVFRRLDELLTSMILNMAEGNGRFSDADQVRFLGTAHESAVKLAARLDLCVTQAMLPASEVISWKALLERVSVMTASMIVSIKR